MLSIDWSSETMKFVLWTVQNGFLLNVTRGQNAKSYVFKLDERMKMLAYIDKLLGEDPYEERKEEERTP